jgi:hypothetical protein
MIDATPRQELPPASLALALAQIPGLRGQLGVKGITPFISLELNIGSPGGHLSTQERPRLGLINMGCEVLPLETCTFGKLNP